MIGYIYMTTNLVNGKRYIGRKYSPTFLGTKYLGSGKHLKNAIKKYGKENFTVKMIDSCNSSEELYLKEEYWISQYNAVKSEEFYNHSPGGREDGFLVGEENIIHHLSDVSREKLIESRRGRKDSLETREKKAKALLGIKRSPETRKKMSISQSGERNPSYGKKSYPETCRKLSQLRTGSGNPIYNKICVNDGLRDKFVSKEDVDKYLIGGWTLGTIKKPPSTAGKIFINNSIENRVCSIEDFPYYESLGYVRGRMRNKKSSTTIETLASKKSTSENGVE